MKYVEYACAPSVLLAYFEIEIIGEGRTDAPETLPRNGSRNPGFIPMRRIHGVYIYNGREKLTMLRNPFPALVVEPRDEARSTLVKEFVVSVRGERNCRIFAVGESPWKTFFNSETDIELSPPDFHPWNMLLDPQADTRRRIVEVVRRETGDNPEEIVEHVMGLLDANPGFRCDAFWRITGENASISSPKPLEQLRDRDPAFFARILRFLRTLTPGRNANLHLGKWLSDPSSEGSGIFLRRAGKAYPASLAIVDIVVEAMLENRAVGESTLFVLDAAESDIVIPRLHRLFSGELPIIAAFESVECMKRTSPDSSVIVRTAKQRSGSVFEKARPENDRNSRLYDLRDATHAPSILCPSSSTFVLDELGAKRTPTILCAADEGARKTDLVARIVGEIRLKYPKDRLVVLDMFGRVMERTWREGDLIESPGDARSVQWSLSGKNDSQELSWALFAPCRDESHNERFWNSLALDIFRAATALFRERGKPFGNNDLLEFFTRLDTNSIRREFESSPSAKDFVHILDKDVVAATVLSVVASKLKTLVPEKSPVAPEFSFGEWSRDASTEGGSVYLVTEPDSGHAAAERCSAMLDAAFFCTPKDGHPTWIIVNDLDFIPPPRFLRLDEKYVFDSNARKIASVVVCSKLPSDIAANDFDIVILGRGYPLGKGCGDMGNMFVSRGDVSEPSRRSTEACRIHLHDKGSADGPSRFLAAPPPPLSIAGRNLEKNERDGGIFIVDANNERRIGAIRDFLKSARDTANERLLVFDAVGGAYVDALYDKSRDVVIAPGDERHVHWNLFDDLGFGLDSGQVADMLVQKGTEGWGRNFAVELMKMVLERAQTSPRNTTGAMEGFRNMVNACSSFQGIFNYAKDGDGYLLYELSDAIDRGIFKTGHDKFLSAASLVLAKRDDGSAFSFSDWLGENGNDVRSVFLLSPPDTPLLNGYAFLAARLALSKLLTSGAKDVRASFDEFSLLESSSILRNFLGAGQNCPRIVLGSSCLNYLCAEFDLPTIAKFCGVAFIGDLATNECRTTAGSLFPNATRL